MVKSPAFYIDILASFAIIVVLDWFIEAGFKLFQGSSFTQTLENYKIPFAFLGVAVAIAFSKHSKRATR